MFGLCATLCNRKVKDTPKYKKTLHERRFMREFEENRETLTPRGVLRC